MTLPFPEIDPIALSIGPLDIRWYALAYMAGFIGGWKYAVHLAGRFPHLRPNKDDIDNFLTYAVIGVILGGRLGYVLFYNLPSYADSPLEAFKIWEGGMAFHGGVLGVIAAILIYAWRHKIPVLRLSDIVCAVVPIGLFFGRIANFINGELYGRITTMPWGIVFPHGGSEPRHPSQLYEAIMEGAILFLILLLLNKNKWAQNHDGIITGAFLSLYAAFRFIIEFYREPDFHLGFIVNELSMGQILCIPMFLLGAAVLTYGARHKA